MMRCYLCACKIKNNYETCDCCQHNYCYDCYSRIEYFFINMPDDVKEDMLGFVNYNSLICPCSCDNGHICLTPNQMDDFIDSF